MKIYTKKGDQGLTSTISRSGVSKADELISALGDLDELNSLLGLLLVAINKEVKNSKFKPRLLQQQSNILNLGAMLAWSNGAQYQGPAISEVEVASLEEEIDAWQEQLPPLTNFILPGGSEAAAYAHHARSVCRRAERSVVRAAAEISLSPIILKYLNRLSDWLFVLARTLNKGEDILWSKGEIK